MHWVVTAIRRSFDYSGRSRRMEYWAFALFAFVVVNVVQFIEMQLGLAGGDSSNTRAGFLGSMVGLALLVSGLAVSVRRLHDSNLAGWWVNLPIAPIVIFTVAMVAGFEGELALRVFMVSFLLGLVALIVLMCLPGTRGRNRFGDDPKSNLGDTFA